MGEVRLEKSWKQALEPEFGKPYWQTLTSFVRDQYRSKLVYPPPKNIFNAFELCPLESVKVVIVGQDPYHGAGQATGLSFAVNNGVTLPPSLKNIYKEIHDELGITPLPTGDLTRWAKQGVFLLNSVLTVAANTPASHAGKGWEEFTDAVIRTLNNSRSHIVYMLWGKYAQAKGAVINKEHNLVLSSGHPSPFSAHLFLGNGHFKKANDYLSAHGMKPINWE